MSSDNFNPQDEIIALRKDIAKLRKRVSELEGQDQSTSVGSTGDPREQAVLDALAQQGGASFTVKELKEIYRRSTDVSNKNTLQRRLKQLTDRSEFERDASHPGIAWRFVGGDDDE